LRRQEHRFAALRVIVAALSKEKSGAAGWIAIALLVLAEYGLFRQFALREVVWAYPTKFDQAAALRRSYETFEKVRTDGLLAGIRDRLSQPAPTGVLMPIEAAVLYLVIGPSRLSALTVNFLHFALFQVVLLYTLRWWSGRWAPGWLGLGLLLSASAPFAAAGGLMDFRMDTLALCLWGVFMCAVIRSGVFAQRAWSIASGAVAGVLVVVRFLTLAYVAGVLTVLFLFLLTRHARGGVSREAGATSTPGGVVAAGLMMSAVALPALAGNMETIRNYYGPGHFFGFERQIWLREQHLSTAWDNLLYYPRSLALDQAGPLMLWMCAIAVVVAAVVARMTKDSPEDTPRSDFVTTGVFVGSCFLVPLIVLTVDAVKSGVVASILVPPLLWITLVLVIRLTGAVRGRRIPPLREKALAGLSALATLVGAWHQLDQMRRPGPLAGQRRDISEVLSLYDTIGEHSRRLGWSAPRVSMDRIAEFLNPGLVPAVVYERRGLLLGYNGALGSRIFAITEQEALALAEGSDFVVVTDDGPDLSPFPFESSMRAIRPSLRRLCDERFARLGEFHFFGREATLYARAP
jgi:hypothetical protein